MKAVYNFQTGKSLQLSDEADVQSFHLNNGANDNYLLSGKYTNYSEAYFRKDQRPDVYLINSLDGSREYIDRKIDNYYFYYKFSEYGKYVVWHGKDDASFCTYNIETKVKTNLTQKLPEGIRKELELADLENCRYQNGAPYWFPDDEGVLLYDRYDIWLLDPSGLKDPVNITNGYGRKK